MLDCPAQLFRCTFDAQEIVPGQLAPTAAAFGKTFAEFCATVSASIAYRAAHGVAAKSARVGVLLPPLAPNGAGYGPEEIRAIETTLRDHNYEPVSLPWPPVLGQPLLVAAATLDFVVVDVGDDPISAAAVAFLHGRFLPALRLRQLTAGADPVSTLERTLYGSIGVGYPNDIVRWSTTAELETGVRSRVQVVDLPPARINTRAQAEEYFGRSAKRPVNVFLSYSGRDEAVAAKISKALGERFQKVFDYKDGKSIRPGEPWIKEIFDQLSTAALAIPLVSDDYFASGNCEHEAREIVARRDNDRLHVIPVKLASKVSVPSWFGDTQYERAFAVNGDVAALVQGIVALVDARAKSSTKSPTVMV
jgi:hypothetical protein